MNVIRTAYQIERPGEPLPDPMAISHRNLRLLILSAFKAGATYGFEEVISLSKTTQ